MALILGKEVEATLDLIGDLAGVVLTLTMISNQEEETHLIISSREEGAEEEVASTIEAEVDLVQVVVLEEGILTVMDLGLMEGKNLPQIMNSV